MDHGEWPYVRSRVHDHHRGQGFTEKQKGKGAEEKKYFKRDRGKKKRHRAGKTADKKASGEKPESGPVDSSKQSESKDKGRSFARRRKFWKKKKN